VPNRELTIELLESERERLERLLDKLSKHTTNVMDEVDTINRLIVLRTTGDDIELYEPTTNGKGKSNGPRFIGTQDGIKVPKTRRGWQSLWDRDREAFHELASQYGVYSGRGIRSSTLINQILEAQSES
jgi:hypothetical protein